MTTWWQLEEGGIGGIGKGWWSVERIINARLHIIDIVLLFER